MAHWSVPPYHVLFYAFELYLSIGSYLFRGFLLAFFTCSLVRTILLLVSSEGQLTFSLDRTALSFFLCCLCVYYITSLKIVNTFLKINLNFFIFFCVIIFICEFSEDSCNISVILSISFTIHHLPAAYACFSPSYKVRYISSKRDRPTHRSREQNTTTGGIR